MKRLELGARAVIRDSALKLTWGIIYGLHIPLAEMSLCVYFLNHRDPKRSAHTFMLANVHRHIHAGWCWLLPYVSRQSPKSQGPIGRMMAYLVRSSVLRTLGGFLPCGIGQTA